MVFKKRKKDVGNMPGQLEQGIKGYTVTFYTFTLHFSNSENVRANIVISLHYCVFDFVRDILENSNLWTRTIVGAFGSLNHFLLRAGNLVLLWGEHRVWIPGTWDELLTRAPRQILDLWWEIQQVSYSPRQTLWAVKTSLELVAWVAFKIFIASVGKLDSH